jgi:hypothetical protein
MPADDPGGRLDLLVDPSSNLSTKYTFLFPGLDLIPRTSLHASTVFRSRSRAPLSTFRNSWMPAKEVMPHPSEVRRRQTKPAAATVVVAQPSLSTRPTGHTMTERVRTGAVFAGGLPMGYTITAAFLLVVVAGSFAAAILSGYGLVQLIASAL